MAIRIYAMTHKQFDEPDDKMYVPLQVGSAVAKDLGYVRDDTGDNISVQNCYYSELTGLYWIWKNVHDIDYVGTCHYRRYLLNSQDLVFKEQELEDILKEYDIITSMCLTLDFSYHYGFGDNHNIRDLDITGEVIKEMYPEYYDTFNKLVNSNHTYFGNIAIMSKKLYDSYCEWLFGIFFEVQKRIDIEQYDDYHKRVFGFISEFLLYVWVNVNNLKAYECKVGLIGEKAETKEVKKELALYFKKKDVQGAKKYFMEYYKKRPDILMEASDVNGDLRVCMQVIATVEAEIVNEKESVFERIEGFDNLMHAFKVFNGVVKRYISGINDEYDIELIKKLEMSDEAVGVALAAFCKEKERIPEISDIIKQESEKE